MTPDTPVYSLDECFNYLQKNNWQLFFLGPDDRTTVRAGMLRSFYYHLGCAKFGVPFNPDVEVLARDIAIRIAAQKAAKEAGP